MDGKSTPVVVKKEPVTDVEDEIQETAVHIASESVTAEPVPKKLKSSKKTKSPKKQHKKVKTIKTEVPTPVVIKEEKIKKASKMEEETYVEIPRAEVYPDRTMSDFYCKVCDAHMNSVQVWESHIQGKRHLKNTKKDATAPVTIKKEKPDDVAGLYYIDTRGAPSPSLDSMGYERRPVSPPASTWKHRSSPEPPSPSAAVNYGELNITPFERMDFMCRLSESIFPQSDRDVKEIKNIISSLSKTILQFRIRQLPFPLQERLINGLGAHGVKIEREHPREKNYRG